MVVDTKISLTPVSKSGPDTAAKAYDLSGVRGRLIWIRILQQLNAVVQT